MENKKIECPFCNSSNCFEEEYPIHNAPKYMSKFKSDIIQTWMCMKCGYNSSSTYKKHTKELKEMLNTSPKLVVDLKKWDDERQIYWFPAIITISSKGMLYPDGDKDFWQWQYIPVVKIKKKEREQYRIPGTKGNGKNCFLKQRYAMELAQTFEREDFKEALRAMGAIVQIDE